MKEGGVGGLLTYLFIITPNHLPERNLLAETVSGFIWINGLRGEVRCGDLSRRRENWDRGGVPAVGAAKERGVFTSDGMTEKYTHLFFTLAFFFCGLAGVEVWLGGPLPSLTLEGASFTVGGGSSSARSWTSTAGAAPDGAVTVVPEETRDRLCPPESVVKTLHGAPAEPCSTHCHSSSFLLLHYQ